MAKHLAPPKTKKHARPRDAERIKKVTAEETIDEERKPKKRKLPKLGMPKFSLPKLPALKTLGAKLGTLPVWTWNEPLLLKLGLALLAAAIVVAGRMLGMFGWRFVLLCMAAYLLAGHSVILGAVRNLLEKRFLSYELLLCIGTIIFFSVGHATAACGTMVLCLFLSAILTWLQEKCRSIVAQETVRIEEALVITELGPMRAYASELEVGDRVLVHAGELIPVDGTVEEGQSSADPVLLTHIPDCIALAPGTKVVSGWKNIEQDITIRCEAAAENSTAQRLTGYMENSCRGRTSQEKLAEQAAMFVTPILAAAGLLLALAAIWVPDHAAALLERSAAFFVIASTELYLSSMRTSVPGGIVTAFLKGIVIKSIRYVDRFGRPATVAFSKRGVITDGSYYITHVHASRISRQDLIDLAAAAETHSTHPVALSLKKAAVTVTGKTVRAIEEIPGRGCASFVGDTLVLVGNAFFMEEHGISIRVPSYFGVALHVAANNEYLGYIMLNDSVREEAFDVVETVRGLGVEEMVLVTGDFSPNARKDAYRLNFDMVKAGLTPEGKLQAIEALERRKNDGSSVVYISQGEDDTALLERADVGIAIHAAIGTKAFESADIAILVDDLSKVAEARKICCDCMQTEYVELIAAGAVKAALVLLSILGWVNVMAAALIDAFAVIALTVYSLRSYRILLKKALKGKLWEKILK